MLIIDRNLLIKVIIKEYQFYIFDFNNLYIEKYDLVFINIYFLNINIYF